MGYCIRLFTDTPLSTLVPVQAQMIQRGYQVQPAGTNQLDIRYDAARDPLTIDLTDSSQQTTREAVAEFLDAVARLPHSPEQQDVLNFLPQTQALVTVGVPDDYESASGALDEVGDIVSNAAAGLFQVDGEGFYDGSNLILALK
jgi:hypothetical protein